MVIEIPDAMAEMLLPDLRSMREMYEDEYRDDWWDADDIAKNVALLMLDRMEAACEK